MSNLREDQDGYKFLSKKDLFYTLNYLNKLKHNSNELKQLNPIDYLNKEEINLDIVNAIKETRADIKAILDD